MEVALIEKYNLLMAPQGEGGGGMVGTLVMFSLIIVIFYFMILRPQQKRQKDRQRLLAGVKKGDRIVTAGGVHASVLAVEDTTLFIQIAENVKVKLDKSAVSSVVRHAEGETGAKP